MPESTTTTAPAVADPLDEVIIDPVTKLKITRRQWEAIGTTSKPVEVSRPSDANYIYVSEEKPTTAPAAPAASAMFPPLPATEKSKRITQANKILKPHRRSNKPKRDS